VTTLEGGFRAWKEAGYPFEELDLDEELPPSEYLPEIPRISVHKVKAKLDEGANVIIIDSRHGHSYDESHIPGSISIPLDNMSEPYNKFESYDEIITYCT
jgi:rhodanese-related sulfurtransferase